MNQAARGGVDAVTFDVDWAPEWAIERCLSLCEAASVRTTWLLTHESPALAEAGRRGQVELGIHPNFLPGSSHGASVADVMATMANLVPGARVMRTHALVQSSPLLDEIAREAPEIIADLSLLLYGHAGADVVEHWLGRRESGRLLLRLPYVWEDDVAAEHPGWSWDTIARPAARGLRILNFHPIHVALNTDRISRYVDWRSSLPTASITHAARASMEGFRNDGPGARTYLERVLATVGAHAATVGEIAEGYASAAKGTTKKLG